MLASKLVGKPFDMAIKLRVNGSGRDYTDDAALALPRIDGFVLAPWLQHSCQAWAF